MRFRPCIDIHNGQVKQIVGGSLLDEGNRARENFVSGQDAAFFAKLYKEKGIWGGHIILLNPESSDYFSRTRGQALDALAVYPGGLQVGGGIRKDNAAGWLDAGASHVIITSYVFKNGDISYSNLERMKSAVGKERLVLDLSCRKKDGQYFIVTDRWQKFTNVPVTKELLKEMKSYCDEFLIHAVDVEGKAAGIEGELVDLLADTGEQFSVTYAGGVGSYEDLQELKERGKNKIDVTIGSALDLFGGKMDFETVLEACK